MITPEDKELLAKKGISEVQIAEQLACFQKGFPYLKLDAAASVEKGILAPDAEEQKAYLAAWNAFISPMGCQSALGNIVHTLRTNLYFNPFAFGPHNSDV